MQKKFLSIGDIPAFLWGPPGRRVFLAVHGNLSHKEDTVIRLLAEAAGERGWQTLSFDLPGHGSRKATASPCLMKDAVADVSRVLAHARQAWDEVGLFGCSTGAYLGLLACRDAPIVQALFLSPVVDMARLVRDMMAGASVTEDRLRREGAVVTPEQQAFYWDDYVYVSSHDILRWDAPTSILYGTNDALASSDAVERFCARFHCLLDRVEGGEHFFHTPEQLAAYRRWLTRRIQL